MGKRLNRSVFLSIGKGLNRTNQLEFRLFKLLKAKVKIEYNRLI